MTRFLRIVSLLGLVTAPACERQRLLDPETDVPPRASAIETKPDEQPGSRLVPVDVAAEELTRVEVEFVEDDVLAVGKLGRRDVLVAEPNLRLASYRPLTRQRGVIAKRDGPGARAKVAEYRLIDLGDGATLATFVDLLATYPERGVGMAVQQDGRQTWTVLFHEDGTVVRLWPNSEQGRRHAVLHPVLPLAWVFDEDSEHGPRLAPWPDTSSPPPEPNLELPGFVDWSDRAVRPSGRLGPTPADPAGTPLFVDLLDDDCSKIELRVEGFACVVRRELALADGWRFGYGHLDGGFQAFNPSPPRVQRFQIEEDCRIGGAVLDPPRVELMCAESNRWYVWSPKHLRRGAADAIRAELFVDTVGGRVLTTGDGGAYWVDTRNDDARWVMFRRDVPPFGAYALDLEAAKALTIPGLEGRCDDMWTAAHDPPRFAIGCVWPGGEVRVVDLEHRGVWRLPPVADVWIEPEGMRVITVEGKGAKTRVVSIDLLGADASTR